MSARPTTKRVVTVKLAATAVIMVTRAMCMHWKLWAQVAMSVRHMGSFSSRMLNFLTRKKKSQWNGKFRRRVMELGEK